MAAEIKELEAVLQKMGYTVVAKAEWIKGMGWLHVIIQNPADAARVAYGCGTRLGVKFARILPGRGFIHIWLFLPRDQVLVTIQLTREEVRKMIELLTKSEEV